VLFYFIIFTPKWFAVTGSHQCRTKIYIAVQNLQNLTISVPFC